MVKAHKHDIDAFEHATKKYEDGDVKAFASKTLPVLKEHLEMAKEIEGNLK